MKLHLPFLACAASLLPFLPVDRAEAAKPTTYRDMVESAQPTLSWHFDAELPRDAKLVGGAKVSSNGPTAPLFPLFSPSNKALSLDGRGAHIRYDDPGDASPLDFTNGDAITIEAWVNLTSLGNDRNIYVIGKGRTNNAGVSADNQNYALRLRGVGGSARASFLFRTADQEGSPGEFHRWNTDAGFAPGTGWHHVAVSYTFGKPESIRGYVDGRPSAGSWDMGGPTNRPPVVDNDQLWIGSALGGSPGNSFAGQLDALAIYRRALPEAEIASRFKIDPKALIVDLPEPPEGKVLVEVIEGVTSNSWQLPPRAKVSRSFELPRFGFVKLPNKYDDHGIISDFAAPLTVRSFLKKDLPAGEYQILLRSLDGSRLLIDGRPVGTTPFLRTGGSAHGHVPELTEPDDPEQHPPPIGHSEKIVTVALTGGEHIFQWELLAGGKNNRPEVGQPLVAIKRTEEKQFEILSAVDNASLPLTYAGYDAFVAAAANELDIVNQANRRAAAANDDDYWHHRHETARQIVLNKPSTFDPPRNTKLPVNNDVDRYINAKLVELDQQVSELTGDHAFIRRVSLDTRGIIPTPEEIEAFLADGRSDRRARLIDRFLADPRWADHWVPYWQDVLAENPGILKPMLNNTGPFRFWIHESFADNKPLDRFVTELLAMEGSTYGGGPAGFALATQNDSPGAAKAHIAAQAFLGVEMKCARCHDAPYHPFQQRDLFEIASMLDRKPIKLPKSSTVPVDPDGRQPLVEITLKPGETIKPQWPFAEEIVGEELPAGFVRSDNDSRERLAALFTSPHNERFTQVAVNRMWHRYLGIGIVEPVDDWHDAEPSHPALLEFLARELVLSGYDLKHIARLILNSHAYQRQPTAGSSNPLSPRLRSFAAPARRRLSAEQIVDSAFVAAGKDFNAEQLTLDPENRRAWKTFINLGKPTRSWEFVSLSNERDRPALALPVAQSFVDILQMFGWRDSRQNPLTVREEAPTALQPLTLGNGVIGNRMATLSADSAFTQVALTEKSPEELIDAVALRVLSRPATTTEHELFRPLIAEGFEDRVIRDQEPPAERPTRHAVSWANHLSAEATRIKQELEAEAQRGDPPTGRLDADWRQRMEDVIWALANSPEFMFAP